MTTNMAFCGNLKSLSIQQWSSHQFSILGRTIARHPLYFLAIPVIIAAVLSTGCLCLKINRDLDSIYTDANGEAAKIKSLIQSLFPINTSIYNDLVRLTAMSNMTLVLLVAKDKGSMLRKHVMEEAAELHNSVKNVEVEWRGKMANYSVLCGRTIGIREDLFEEITSNYRKIRDGEHKIKYPIQIDNYTFNFKDYVSVMGNVKLDDEGYVKDIESMMSLYLMDFSNSAKVEAISKWERAVTNYIRNKAFKYIDITVLNKQANYESSQALTFEILKLMPFVVGILLCFSALTCMTDDWTTSKPGLGLSACLSALLAIVSGFGLTIIMGIEYTDSYLVVVYAALALEVDDAFVLISAWRTTIPSDTVSKRMEQSYGNTASSITVTSLTNVLSCSIGIATSVPAFRSLCSIAACFSFFSYVYQITFFGACMALSGYIEEGNASLMLCPKTRKTEIRSETSLRVKKGDIFMLHTRNTLGDLLLYPVIKVIIILAFLANLAISGWGWTYLQYGLGLEDFFPADTFVTKFAEMKYKYFAEYAPPIHVVIKDTMNYADSDVQKSIETLVQRLESHPNIADSSLRVSWLTYYNKFAQHPFGKFFLSGYNMSDKQDFIDGLRYVFLRNIRAKQFNFDIAFNENYTDIVASRFLLLMKDINSTETEIAAIKEIHEIASKSEIPVKIFGFTFHLLEQAWIIKSMAIQIACPAVGLVCLIFFVLSQNIRSSLCVSFVVLCIICEVIGYCCMWGVRLDLATLTIFIVSVGFSINSTAHMAFVFVTETKMESRERVKNAMYRVGFPLIQGALSTILSLSIFAFQPLYVLTSTFKILCLMSLQTTLHSLLLVPVLLDLTGNFSKPVTATFVDGSAVPLFRFKNKSDEKNNEIVNRNKATN